MRSGQRYRGDLDDGRDVWIAGERVVNVARHPFLESTVDAFADALDMQYRPETADLMVRRSTSEESIPRWAHLPRSVDDLTAMGKMSAALTQASLGLVGRGWDSSGSYAAGLYDRRGAIGACSARARATIEGLYQRVAYRTALVSVAIIEASPHAGSGEPPGVRVVDTVPGGIVVSGAKTICTGAPYADEIIVIKSGHALDRGLRGHNIGFLVPPKAPGLTILCRRTSKRPDEIETLPRRCAVDEMEAMLVFDRVAIPHEHVLYVDEPEAAKLIWSTVVDWDKHCLARRLATKLDILHGLGTLMADALACADRPRVRDMLFSLGRHHATVAALVDAAEHSPVLAPGGGGASIPEPKLLYLAMFHALEALPAISDALLLLGGHSMVLVPSDADLRHPELRGRFARYLRGPQGDVRDRARLFALAAELTGSNSSSRQRLLDYYTLGGIEALVGMLSAAFDGRPAANLLWNAVTAPS